MPVILKRGLERAKAKIRVTKFGYMEHRVSLVGCSPFQEGGVFTYMLLNEDPCTSQQQKLPTYER